MTTDRVSVDTMVAALGRRYCSDGGHEALAEGGKILVAGNGRKRWICAKCLQYKGKKQAKR